MRIVFLIPYFGKWPVWFPAFLASCRTNSTVDWFFFTDIELPAYYPENIKFHHLTLKDIRMMASEKVGFDVALTHPYKLCDLKPAYGDIFLPYISDYDFWGFCDIDIIWGRIKHFIRDVDFEQFDVITAMQGRVAGHFTLLRNTPYLRELYRQNIQIKPIFSDSVYRWFDEHVFSDFLKELEIQRQIKVGWHEDFLKEGIVSPNHLDYLVDRWIYEDGCLFELDEKLNKVHEYLYLHFISWKRTMKVCKVDVIDSKFLISYDTIQRERSGRLKRLTNPLLRKFWGYQHRVRFAMWKRKIMKLIDRWKTSTL